jgi:glycoside/pentoside/hexuronide:cation symporter, GPH family
MPRMSKTPTQTAADTPRAAMPTAGRLTLGAKIVYGLGDWGGSATSTIFIFFFAFFLSDIARLPLQLSGLVLLVGGIWDAVNDPLIGVLVDRARTRWGRRRPFFLFGALPLAVTFTMLWWVPPWGDLGRATWFALAYVLFDTSFTLVTVPYGALTAEITEDYDERTNLTGWRMALNLLGGLMAAFFVPVIVGVFARQATGYFVAAAAFGLLAAVPYLMLFFTTKERFAATAPPRESLVASFTATLKNRIFRYIAAVYMLSWVTVNLVASLLQYYVTWWVRIPDQLEFVLVVVQAVAIACVPLVVLLSGRLGKRGAYIVTAGWWALVMLGLAVIPGTARTLAYVLAGLAGLGVAGAQVIPWSMVPDVVEADELLSGRRREGAYYGVVAFLQKSGTAFVLAIVQWVLALTGYRPGEQQPASALLAIRLMIGAAPALLLGISIFVAARSPLGRKEHAALLRTLEQRRAMKAPRA